jgi:hypothetical protein
MWWKLRQMEAYENQMRADLAVWQGRMRKNPSFINRMSKDLQVRINRVIPEKVHKVITTAIETMTRAVLTGAGFTTSAGVEGLDLAGREVQVQEKIKFYRNASTAEGAITGAGGILLGLADFPIWLTLKMKMLFEIAAQYGYSVDDYKERVFILHIFQLTFSSQANRQKVFSQMERWEQYKNELPASIDDFDWRTFQQEYRDYIDIAKLLQLIPGIGAAVGAYVNHSLTEKLGHNAMQAYRMRALSNRNDLIP